ncbi:hypothetical protein SMSP2_02153 [Limihaloglobus sulfuriphilus]|uniref:Uncharacterized protein n=1 Tax=Limihaloglobus sulfuriphilus TaxID=1851148 RepID=A0A1Q2MGE6_9BACT|nr:BsuBI/PstI family type II restriction endonuclease [Limihaloglobus sulfuriphilus]AQQ71775.1 hypothetical protein SMSP2_02153 [Limihaloglobus sulfuriphilus]
MGTIRKTKHIEEAILILKDFGLPKEQQNVRSGLCLLALLDLKPAAKWQNASNPLIGITPIMEWMKFYYNKDYKPNTRETVRRQSIHQFVQAGIALHNPDRPDRPVNSPKAVYQISPHVLETVKHFGKTTWKQKLHEFLNKRETLVQQYARERKQYLVAVQINKKKHIQLSPGIHSELIKAVVEDFGARFVPDGKLIYVGDTGNKWGYFDETLLAELGVQVDSHGKMPDVVIFCQKRKWLILVESVTSHGPVNSKRHIELEKMFSKSQAGIVYVTAFPSRSIMARYLNDIAWETDVWVAQDPSHLIHFNGVRFLGPYS